MPSSSAGSRRDNIATHLYLNLYPSCMCIDAICRHPLYIRKVQLFVSICNYIRNSFEPITFSIAQKYRNKEAGCKRLLAELCSIRSENVISKKGFIDSK